MVKVGKWEGIDTYVAMDKEGETVLSGRKTLTAAIPVRGRSVPQNAVWAVFYRYIGKHTGQTPEEAKRECKLNYGVPILVAEDEKFRRMWLAKFDSDTYEQKLFMMRYLPVTSILSKGQGIIYTETLQREYAKQGLRLEITN